MAKTKNELNFKALEEIMSKKTDQELIQLYGETEKLKDTDVFNIPALLDFGREINPYRNKTIPIAESVKLVIFEEMAKRYFYLKIMR